MRSIGHGQHFTSAPGRLWAVFFSFSQQWTLSCDSASVSLRHVFRGLPLFPFPCGFQVSTCLVMLMAVILRMWSIRAHFLLQICAATGSWSAALHRSSLLIFSVHRILRMLRRQLLTKVWSLWSVD